MEVLDEFLAKNFLLIKVLEAENDYDVNFYNDDEINSYVLKINEKIENLKRLCNEIVKIKNENNCEIVRHYKNEQEIERLTKLKDMNDEYVKINEELIKVEKENICTCKEIENRKVELKKIQELIENEKKRVNEKEEEEQKFYDKSIEKCREITCLEDNIKEIKEKEKQVATSIQDDEKNIHMLEKHLKNILKLLLKCQRSYEAFIVGEEEDGETHLNFLDTELKNLKKIEHEIKIPESELFYESSIEEINSEVMIENLEKELKDIYKNIEENVKQLNDIEGEIFNYQLKKLEKQLAYGEIKVRFDIQNIKEKRLQQIELIEKILPKPTIYQTYKSNQLKKNVPTIYTDDKNEVNFDDSNDSSKRNELKQIKEQIEINTVLINNMEQGYKDNLELQMATLLAEDDEDLLPLVQELSESVAKCEIEISHTILSQRIKFLKDILQDGISLLQDERIILQKKLSLISNEVNDQHSSISRLQADILLKEKNLNKCIKNKIINEEKYQNIIEKMNSDNYEEYQKKLEKINLQEEEINELKESYEYLTRQYNEKKVELNQKKVDNNNLSNKLKVATKKYEENVAQHQQEEVIEQVNVQLEKDIMLLKKEINGKRKILKNLEEANENLKKEIKEIEMDREFNFFF